MEIIFREKYVNYNQISDVQLMDINDMLIANNMYLELGDKFTNDWAGYCYYYCKSLDEMDRLTISSFAYIITWFMTGNPINVPIYLKSDKYYKNDKIISECLKIYNNLYEKYESEVELCKELFKQIYDFYLTDSKNYLKRTERINILLTYKDLKLFDNISKDSRSDNMKILLDYYYK